ncbi:heterokaryon incompatibility protein-domain-containing protein [Schizothecium vesticola]|uniref:Heterokaryon incompatibility protein-domain-containing protein n=1 Tax=Schizothecium vesticola TaxID=314040 RepID=A0AA40KA81_9PEZI|nr:heterokaryon incompatibility protein-domain-containing protein [Schizothecium vesticola]
MTLPSPATKSACSNSSTTSTPRLGPPPSTSASSASPFTPPPAPLPRHVLRLGRPHPLPLRPYSPRQRARRLPHPPQRPGLLPRHARPARPRGIPPAATWWWMDCVCINQADPAERGAQVELMSAIYRGARATVVWLGEASADSDAAVAFLHLLAAQDRAGSPSLDQVDVREARDEWCAVAGLLSREWWERAWTLQEFLMGEGTVMYCGGSSIGVDDMFWAVGRVWVWSQYQPSLAGLIPRTMYEKAWNRLRLLEWYRNRGEMPLVGMMAYTATSRVTDPRDRIYSLLGLATDKDRSVVGRPDYSCDAAVVYSRFARAFVEIHQSLDIVCVARALDDDLVEADDEQPGLYGRLASWVPDWSLRCMFSPPVLCLASQSASTHIGNFRPLHSWKHLCSYEASGKNLPSVSFSDDLGEMTCAGFLVDRIDGLGGVKPARHPLIELVHSTSTVNSASETVITSESASLLEMDEKMQDNSFLLFDRLARCLSLDRQDRYLRHAAPRIRFSREFEVLCRTASDTPERVFPAFSHWFLNNRDLRIGGLSLSEAISHTASAETAALPSSAGQRGTALERGQHAQDIADITDWDGFLSRARTTTSSMGKRLMVTNTGLVGMAPKRAEKGDVVCILLGCSIPLVLRPSPSGANTFTLVGECYLDEYMNGEILQGVGAQRRETREFCII